MPRLILLLLITALPVLTRAEVDYFPLAIGTEWTWEITKILPEGETFKGVAHDKVVGPVTKNGHEYIQVDQTLTWGKEDKSQGIKNHFSSSFMRRTSKGYFRSNGSAAGETLLYQLPFRNGATWETEWMDRPLTTKVLISSSAPFTLTTGGKTYTNCALIRDDSPLPLFVTRWLAPSVGTVQEITTGPDHTKTLLTLKKFKAGR